MTRTAQPRPTATPRVLFVGGPGRSGTSFIADRLGAHPEVAALRDIELKIFCEKNGLQDLFHALVETYSPNRAATAAAQFRQMTQALIQGRYGQPPLTEAAPESAWRTLFDTFLTRLERDGHPCPAHPTAFLEAARELLGGIAALAAGSARGGGGHPGEGPQLFLEKTPHNLLALRFLVQLAPGALYLHVMRDPRSIAWSLTRMRWGPDSLDTAAAWVGAYCEAWLEAEAFAARLGLPLIRLHIEDVARAPARHAQALCDALGIARRADLFAGASAEVLSRWTAQASAAERALLDSRLRGWVRHFGYAQDEIGERPADPICRATRRPPEPDVAAGEGEPEGAETSGEPGDSLRAPEEAEPRPEPAAAPSRRTAPATS